MKSQIDLYLNSDGRQYKTILLGEIEELKTIEEAPLIKGEDIISAYRTFELINQTKRISTEKDWRYSYSESWAGFPKIRGSFNICWNQIYGKFFYKNKELNLKSVKKIRKDTGISNEDLNKILTSYPLDDNKEEIKESDLVKLIFS